MTHKGCLKKQKRYHSGEVSDYLGMLAAFLGDEITAAAPAKVDRVLPLSGVRIPKCHPGIHIRIFGITPKNYTN